MQSLVEALVAFAEYKQFILWTVVERHNKKIKLPINPLTLKHCDPHDPTVWVDATTAVTAANLYGDEYGVGFVFTENDPFFFLDIDHCAIDGQWSPLANTLMTLLPGAAVEVSTSGEGLHIFGRGVCPEHRCKNIPLGIELYTEERFVALTGNAVGDANTDCTATLTTLVNQYFPPRTLLSDATWTNQPSPEWKGPTDDNELINKALNSKSAAAAFGSRATFSDLWNRNVEALSAAYQADANDAGSYDESSADAALAQHLAFWTGKDCERIKRIMFQSALVRDKWQREQYMHDTIVNACSMQKDVYASGPVERPREAVTPTYANDQPIILAGFQFLDVTNQLNHFKGCIYVQDLHRIFDSRTGSLLKPDQFNATYGGYVFQLEDNTSGKTTRKAWEAFVESQAVRYPKAQSICFRPELGVGALVEDEGRVLVNTYVPVDTPCEPGDVTPFLTHLAKLLPVERDRTILLSYLAACIQHKGVKFQWCPLIQGVEGNGKTLFSRVVAHAIGKRYTHFPKADDIDNKFNGWMLNKLFIALEDIYVPSHKAEVIEALKPMITNPDLEIQMKGVDQVTMRVCANFLINSNHMDALKKSRNDRRFAPFFTAQQDADDLARDGMDGEYFPNLYAWLRSCGYSHIHHYLSTYAIPDELNPATHCQRAPDTSSTASAIAASAGGIEQEILEAVDEGRQGFAGGWISSMALDRLLQDQRMTRMLPHNKRKKVLEDLGYVYHPSLKDGRSTTISSIDNGKPRLFILKDHIHCNLRSMSEIMRTYTDAQMTGGGVSQTKAGRAFN